jgi:hypothetical protein
MWVSKVVTGKSPMCCPCVLCLLAHLSPPCTPHAATPLKKGLGNDPPLIWLKLLKIIASFATRAMLKTTPEISVVCKRYQFSGFYVK